MRRKTAEKEAFYMRRNVKKGLVFLIAVMLIFAAGGCRERTKTTYICKTPSPYVPQVQGKIRLNCYLARTEAERQSVRNWVAAFNKMYPDCEVEIDFTNYTKDEFYALLASKSAGDVFSLCESNLRYYAEELSIVMPMDAYARVLSTDLSAISPAAYKMGTIDESLYMVVSNYSHTALTYNRGAIAAAELIDPVELDKKGEWTWDTFRAYCETLTNDFNGDGMIDQLGAAIHFGTDPVYLSFLEGYGGSWYDLANKKVNFLSDDPAEMSLAERGINEMVDTVLSGTVRYEPGRGLEGWDAVRSVKDTPELSSYSALDPVTDIVFRDLRFSEFNALANAYETAGIDWDCVSFPALPTHKVGAFAEGYGVNYKTMNPDSAAVLCLFLYTEEGQRAYIGDEGCYMPSMESLREDSIWRAPFTDMKNDPVKGVYYDAWISYPEADTYGQVECVLPSEVAHMMKNMMQNIVPDAVNGVCSVRDALKRLEVEVNEYWTSCPAGD